MKKCPKCNGPLILLRSQNRKRCNDCGERYDWFLKPGQQPLIKYQR